MSRRECVLGSPWLSRLLLLAVLACSDTMTPKRPPPKPRPASALSFAAASDAVVRLIGAGDIANCASVHDAETADQIASYLTQHPDATVFTLGDNVEANATAQDYTDCYAPTWGRFKAATRPAIGDEEYALGNATATFDYFGASVGPRSLGYYSYDAGAWHVVVLNSQTAYVSTSLGSAQETWLKNDLATTTKRCILAYWHNPRFYSSTTATPTVPSSRMRQVWVDLYNAGATLVLNGDVHRYERFAPQDPDGNASSRGIREFIVGTGGDWSGSSIGSLSPNSEVQKVSMYGVLELQLGEGWYSWNYLPIPGRTFSDAGTGTCVNWGTAVPPIASPGGPYAGTAGVAITFDGSTSNDPDGQLPLTYAWSFGDGGTDSGASPTHTYGSAGTYAVSLVVTDSTGLASSPVTTSATVAAPSAGVVRLLGAGDIGNCSSTHDSSTAAVIAKYLTQHPDAGVFTLGDHAMPDGTAQNYNDCYAPTWGPFRAITRPALGNHDYGADNADATFDYFGALAGLRDLGYYSYDVGTSWHIVVLNSVTWHVPANAGSAQETWLRNDLALNTRPCILAYWHHPRFYSTSSGSYGFADETRQLWLDLYAAGASVVLNSHLHQYERYAAQDADGNRTTRGIRQFIVGTGGDVDNGTPTVIAPNSEVQRGSIYGVLELQLGDGAYSWNYLPIPGLAFTDAGTDKCVDRSAEYAPIAKPGGPYTGTTGSIVAFSGDSSVDPDGDLPLTFAWDFGDGITATGPSPMHRFTAAGSYTVTLVVTDATGRASTPAVTTAAITGEANEAPVANAGGPYSGTAGTAVTFDASASSDPDGDMPLAYAWQFGDGATGSGVNASHVYSGAGIYTVSLTVTDARGLASPPITTTATIAARPNEAPVARPGGPYVGSVGRAIALDGSGSSDPDGNLPLTYDWTFGDGTGGAGLKPTHTYASAGTYTVSLTVTDARGLASAPATTIATIAIQPPVATARLIGAGDIANCASVHPAETADLIAGYLTQHPDAIVFTLGDNVTATGTALDYTNCYAPTWGRFKAVTRPSIGDEEYAPGNATATFDYFGANLGPRNLGYYSYDAGAWHVVVLNSQAAYVPTGLGSAQETWLRNDLATTTQRCILAYWHNPRFYSSTSAAPTVPSSRTRQVWLDLYDAGATLILNGDAHRYERFAPQDPDGNATPRGIREIVVGTGGDYSSSTPRTLSPNSEVQKGSIYGVLELQLGDGWYSWKYLPIPGRTFSEAGTGQCVTR